MPLNDFIFGYLLGRYEVPISRFLVRMNRWTRGALAAAFIGFCPPILPAFYLVEADHVLWVCLGCAAIAVIVTSTVHAARRSRRQPARRSDFGRTRNSGHAQPRSIQADAMPVIELTTLIHAPRERVFDLARSIDAHQDSTSNTGERAVAGVTTGLIGLDDEVTWEAKHLGIRQRLSVRISAFDRPNHFRDIIIAGAFKTMVHDHMFADHPKGVVMIDRFEFTSPLGALGCLVDRLFLAAYMRRFLVRRNETLKSIAETDQWRAYLVND